MRLTHRAMLAAACALTVSTTPLPAQDRPTRNDRETVGEKLDSAVQSIKRGAHEAGDAIQQQFERTKTSVHNMGVSGRIYGRLHWDKDLKGSNVRIDVRNDGVVTLTGTVPDAKAKSKAVTLTLDTVGVERVIDRTTIQAAETGTPGTVTTTKETKVETTKP